MTLGEDDSVVVQRCEQKPSLQETRGVSAMLRDSVRSLLCVEGLPPFLRDGCTSWEQKPELTESSGL